MTNHSIESRVTVEKRYVRSIDLARDLEDPDALKGYVVTSCVRDATLRILAGLSPMSSQRAYRVVGPYGVGKSAFGVFLAQLLRERGYGTATNLLRAATQENFNVSPWNPVPVSGRRVCFAKELLRLLLNEYELGIELCGEINSRVHTLLGQDESPDAYEVLEIMSTAATAMRNQTGNGLLLLIDEMGRFVEHAAVSNTDPSIFQVLAERSGGHSDSDLAVIVLMHHRFADYVSGFGRWIEAEWTRSAERYEEVSFASSTEQSLFMLSCALHPVMPHTVSVKECSEKLYVQAVDRGLFAMKHKDIVAVAQNLYPLHPSAVAALACGIRRFSQNERSLFSFLQSLEPAGFKRFVHATRYESNHWYRTPLVFDHLAATVDYVSTSDRTRRWSMARDALAVSGDFPTIHQEVLKTVALLAVLEPIPGLIADAGTIAWSLGIDESAVAQILDEFVKRNILYRRAHRGDYCLWSSSSVDLSRWLKDARTNIPVPKRIKSLDSLPLFSRPAIAHHHYQTTGTLRLFDIQLWTGERPYSRTVDGLILIAPVYPDEDIKTVLSLASESIDGDPLALVCARRIMPADLKWAHELETWHWIRDRCEELKMDDVARLEVNDQISTAAQALTSTTALLSVAKSDREEEWWYIGKPVNVSEGISAFLSEICDKVYDKAPILRNELINRSRLSRAVVSARTRLLDRMLTHADQSDLGIEGAPPEKTVYRSMFFVSGIHSGDGEGKFGFNAPKEDDPNRWMPIWERIEERLTQDDLLSFDTLMMDLGRPPYGLRAGVALLVIAAYIMASRDRVVVMERNSYQPELSVAHFVRLAKAPANFTIRSLKHDSAQEDIVQAIATRVSVIGESRPTISAIGERLFGWYNSLPPHALKTKFLSPLALNVRRTLQKAVEPSRMFFYDLPSICGVFGDDGRIKIDSFVSVLDEALIEINAVMGKLRSKTNGVLWDAFNVSDRASLRAQMYEDFESYRSILVDHRLYVFLERATNKQASDDRWLDGLAGHLTGQRPDNWDDNTFTKFELEVKTVAAQWLKWLALVQSRKNANGDLSSVHVVGGDGREQVVVVRRDGLNPELKVRLKAVRDVLGDDPSAVEVLGHLFVEYADEQTSLSEDRN